MNSIKKIIAILAGATLLLYMPGCFVDDVGIGCIRPDGPVVSERISMAPFTGVDLRMAGKVYITQGSPQRVEVEAPRRLIDEMEFNVRNGIWRIETNRCARYNSRDLRIYITMPDLTSLRISGSGDIISENVFVIDDLDLTISGSGGMDLALDAKDVGATISGSGNIYLEGVADALDFVVSGSGDFRCFDLAANSARINISGSGSAEVHVSEALNVRISGSGNVRYKGTPSIVNTQISGSGKVIKVN
ncbi:MAG TPA: head GIN domain-containing protein [Saprospiraceae bacterium]|nr:head GIN domain-containing protein [Saprospiraceae bacterium]HMP23024.1 head GIN domain-containing protein [Saprospiraceae bacterium]